MILECSTYTLFIQVLDEAWENLPYKEYTHISLPTNIREFIGKAPKHWTKTKKDGKQYKYSISDLRNIVQSLFHQKNMDVNFFKEYFEDILSVEELIRIFNISLNEAEGHYCTLEEFCSGDYQDKTDEEIIRFLADSSDWTYEDASKFYDKQLEILVYFIRCEPNKYDIQSPDTIEAIYEIRKLMRDSNLSYEEADKLYFYTRIVMKTFGLSYEVAKESVLHSYNNSSTSNAIDPFNIPGLCRESLEYLYEAYLDRPYDFEDGE